MKRIPADDDERMEDTGHRSPCIPCEILKEEGRLLANTLSSVDQLSPLTDHDLEDEGEEDCGPFLHLRIEASLFLGPEKGWQQEVKDTKPPVYLCLTPASGRCRSCRRNPRNIFHQPKSTSGKKFIFCCEFHNKSNKDKEDPPEGYGSVLFLWNPEDLTLLHKFQGHRDSVSGVVLRKLTHILYVCSYDAAVKVWDVN